MISKKIISVIGLCALVQSCTPPNVKVSGQAMVYDSINYKGAAFNVNLYTTLEFSEDEIARKAYNDFLVVVEKDTFPLVPQTNDLKVKGREGKITIKYLSYLDFKSKMYDNDSLSQIIRASSRVINSEGKTVNAESAEPLQAYIALRKKIHSDVKLQ